MKWDSNFFFGKFCSWKMSTGKRLAKRSIIGTRVCAAIGDGKYYSGVIHAVKTPACGSENNNCINLTPNTRYSVRFDSKEVGLGRSHMEFFESDLIGPGFRSISGIQLLQGQIVYVTYNGREVCGEVKEHNLETDEVAITINTTGAEVRNRLFSSLSLLEAPAYVYKTKRRAAQCFSKVSTDLNSASFPTGFNIQKQPAHLEQTP